MSLTSTLRKILSTGEHFRTTGAGTVGDPKNQGVVLFRESDGAELDIQSVIDNADALLTELEKKVNATDTQPVSMAAPPAGAATDAALATNTAAVNSVASGISSVLAELQTKGDEATLSAVQAAAESILAELQSEITVQLSSTPTPTVQLASTNLTTLSPDKGQLVDANNTAAITSVDASPGSPWVGPASVTRSEGVIGVFLSVISTGPVSGTYTFKFGEDGVSWPITITVPVDDFSTIRYRELKNVGAYFSAEFEPDAPLGAETVFINTQFARQPDPPFVVPSTHVHEQSDAAFGSVWMYPKFFKQDGNSDDLPGPQVSVGNSTETPPTIAVPFSGLTENVARYSQITVSIIYECSAAHTGTMFLEFSKTGSEWVAVDGGIPMTGTSGALRRFVPRSLTVINSQFRVRYVPDDDNLTTFHLETRYSPFQNLPTIARINTDMVGTEDVMNVRAAIVCEDPLGVPINMRANIAGAPILANWDTEVVKGNVQGHSRFEFSGRTNGLAASGSPNQDLWLGSGVYTGQPDDGLSVTVQVISDSALDTAAGTGAQAVRITGLKTTASTIIESEDIPTNGTLGANSASTWWRIFASEATQYGASGEQQGTITTRRLATPVDVFSAVPAGAGQSQAAVFTVPAGTLGIFKTPNLYMARNNGSDTQGRVAMSLRRFGQGGYNRVKDWQVTNSAPVAPDLREPIEALTDIKFEILDISDSTSSFNADPVIELVPA